MSQRILHLIQFILQLGIVDTIVSLEEERRLGVELVKLTDGCIQELQVWSLDAMVICQ